MIGVYRRDARSSSSSTDSHPAVPFARLRLDILLSSHIPIHRGRLTGNIGQMRLLGQPFDEPGNVFVELRFRPIAILGLYVAELRVVGRYDKRHYFFSAIGNPREMDGTTGGVVVRTVRRSCTYSAVRLLVPTTTTTTTNEKGEGILWRSKTYDIGHLVRVWPRCLAGK